MNLWKHKLFKTRWPCGNNTQADTLYYRKRIFWLDPLCIDTMRHCPLGCHVINPQGYNRHFSLLCFTNLYELFGRSKKQNSTNQESRKKREMGMMSLSSVMLLLLQVMILLGQEIGKVSSTLYKVGDLDSWGIPIDAKVYSKWPKTHSFKIGDSLCK